MTRRTAGLLLLGLAGIWAGAAIITASIYCLSVIDPSHDLSGWQGVGVAWSILGLIFGPCLFLGAPAAAGMWIFEGKERR